MEKVPNAEERRRYFDEDGTMPTLAEIKVAKGPQLDIDDFDDLEPTKLNELAHEFMHEEDSVVIYARLKELIEEVAIFACGQGDVMHPGEVEAIYNS